MQTSSVATAAQLTFALYTVSVFVLAWLAHRVLANREFLSEYFLGSRGLGVAAFTLTFGATAASAGTFAGFPSLIYTHGWVLALWIAGYMMVPICTMGLLGKRLNQLARRCGNITLPDVLRERFQSPAIGIVATTLMVVMLAFFLIPQFKLGSLILQRLLAGTSAISVPADWLRPLTIPLGLDAEYAVCLFYFAASVVIYTTYGGFRAVVWTDMLQGIVMVAGVVMLLILALRSVGGLEAATSQLADMTTPRLGQVTFHLNQPADEPVRIPTDQWFVLNESSGSRLFRINETALIPRGQVASRRVKVVEITTPGEIERIMRKAAAHGQEFTLPQGVTPVVESLREYAYGAGQKGVYLTAPGPVPPSESSDASQLAPTGFLSVGMALSFFAFWTLSGTGQPGSMVRLMAFNSARTLKRSIAALTIYFAAIYFPLVVIFCCARVIYPGLDQTPDRIMPTVAMELATSSGMPWLGGLLVAVPFAAAMSTVDSFMLIISSSIVRDIYQHHFRPDASPRSIKVLSYVATSVIGLVVTIAALDPPKFLQYLIVFASGGLSVAFLVPVAMALYWPRANAKGILAAMLGGVAVYLAFYAVGFAKFGEARPVTLLDFDPFIWGFGASILAGVGVTLATAPPPAELVRKFFFVPAKR